MNRYPSHLSRARCMARLLGAIALGLAIAAHAVSDINDAGDFAQISKEGFGLTVDGAFYIDPDKTRFPNLQPNSGGDQNSYAWSSAWFDGKLWIGTNRDVINPNFLEKGPAEIWAYTPSSFDTLGDWGLSGTWKQVYRAPHLSPLIALVSQGFIPYDTPRDFGYRNMSVCNAGDGVKRLYAVSFGLPGRVLYYNGRTFRETSDRGLPTDLRELAQQDNSDFANIQLDLGYRALACFKGRLWTSPAGSPQDVDASVHHVVYMNPHPSSGAAWQSVVDVSNPASSPLADPDNVGIFQMEVLGNYLWVAVGNRTTGFELWRGDGSDCLEPWVGDGHCKINWVKVIDNGAGRPPDNPFITPVVDNAGATLGVLGNDLMVGASESGFFGITFAEMIRVPDAGSVPAGGAEAPHEWQLIAGWPRRDYAQPAKRLPGLENLDCTSVGDVPNAKAELPPAVQGFWALMAAVYQVYTGVPGIDLVGLDDDYDNDDCLPAAGAGPGMPFGPPYDIVKDPLSLGSASYFWRMGPHQDELFVGTLDVFGGYVFGKAGFDLLRTSNGVDFSVVFDNGLGNGNNYGGRSILSTPIGLVVGTANASVGVVDAYGSPAGGAEVHIGTTAPGPLAAPKADAGPDRVVADADPAGSEPVTLKGRGMDTFGGGGLRVDPFEWFEGAVAGNCVNLDPSDAFSTEAQPQVVLSTGETKTYTLRVIDEDNQVGCDEVTISVVTDLDGPALTITFPANGAGYTPLTYAAGCLTAASDVCGTASDPPAGIASVEAAVRAANGHFWDANSSSFVDTGGQPIWHPAGGAAWSFAFNPPTDGDYTLLARATDGVGNQSGIVEALFGRYNDGVPPSVGISFPESGGSYRVGQFASGCATATGAICGDASDGVTGVRRVELSIRRQSDGAWWNGAGFVSATSPLWLGAAGTTSWSLDFAPAQEGNYRVQARATDLAGNQAVTDPVDFAYYQGPLQRLLLHLPGR